MTLDFQSLSQIHTLDDLISIKKEKLDESFEDTKEVEYNNKNKRFMSIEKFFEKKLIEKLENYTICVNKKKFVVLIKPGSNESNFKIFGSKPLGIVIQDLKNLLNQEQKVESVEIEPSTETSDKYSLPPIDINGYSISIEQMTQIQLRSHISRVLKFLNDGRRPNYGFKETRPNWWPKNIPWARLECDTRSKEDKLEQPWGDALRQIIINCYLYYGREDLIYQHSDEKKVDYKLKSEKNDYQTFCYSILEDLMNS